MVSVYAVSKRSWCLRQQTKGSRALLKACNRLPKYVGMKSGLHLTDSTSPHWEDKELQACHEKPASPLPAPCPLTGMRRLLRMLLRMFFSRYETRSAQETNKANDEARYGRQLHQQSTSSIRRALWIFFRAEITWRFFSLGAPPLSRVLKKKHGSISLFFSLFP